jgi:imidazolonepropionase-like amidohydrolase
MRVCPTDALRAATSNPGQLFPALGVGQIAPDKRADLLLLDGNPLEDIRNTQRIRGVVLRGKFLTRRDLDGLMARSAELAAVN